MNFYVYVIRFVSGHYYFGYHPTYGNDPQFDGYYGTPVTHSEKWLKTMYWKEILGLYETFEEADKAERELIRPCYKSDPLCLNENCGGAISPDFCKIGGQRGGNTNKQSGQAYEWGRKYGRIAVESGQLAEARKNINWETYAERTLEAKKENGRRAVESGQFKQAQEKSWESVRRRHEEKNEEGKSVEAVKLYQECKSKGKGLFNPALKDQVWQGNSEGGKKVASQRWVDPDHPELGERSAGVLTRMQKRRGYPHGKENRVKVG
jgi:hypothetical protein